MMNNREMINMSYSEKKNTSIQKYLPQVNITSSKGGVLEDVLRCTDMIQDHARLVEQAGEIFRRVVSGDAYALENRLVQNFVTKNFGEKTYNTVCGLYQNIFVNEKNNCGGKHD